jgi:hypothetical protein
MRLPGSHLPEADLGGIHEKYDETSPEAPNKDVENARGNGR